MTDTHIDALKMIRESRLHVPDPARAAGTNCGSVAAFEALLKKSREDPDAFWADVAGELEWTRRWDAVREGRFPDFKYFVGGIGNPTVNMHRSPPRERRRQPAGAHLGGRGRREPLLHVRDARARGQQVRERPERSVSGREMPSPSSRPIFRKPSSPCSRASASVRSSTRCSPGSPRERFAIGSNRTPPQVIITADAGLRRGHTVPLKQTVDDAIEGLTSVEPVIVIGRTGRR